MKTTLDLLVEDIPECGVCALLIGGHALPAYGVVRQTIDVDCLIVDTTVDNLSAVLRTRGYKESAHTANFVRYSHPSLYLMDLDVLLVDQSTFDKMLQASSSYRIADRDIRIPSPAHFIALKLHALRNQPERKRKDLTDIVDLLDHNREAVSPEELRALCRQYGPNGIETELENFL